MTQHPEVPAVGVATAGARVRPQAREVDIAASISDAVSALPGVAALSAGEFGRVGTFAAGRSVPGVRVDDERVQVHIIARYGVSLPGTAAQINLAVTPWLAGRDLQVAVQDILLPGEQLADLGPNPDTSGQG